MFGYKKLTTLAAVAALSFGLAACGGSSSTPDPVAPPTPTPTSYQSALTNIGEATTAAAAQAAYDAVKDDVTAAQGEALQAAVDARTAALAKMDREATQKSALMTAAGMVDTSDLSTQDLVDAARTAIAGLRGALDDAADVSDADKAMYQSALDAAVAAVDTAQGGIDTATRRTNQMADLTSASGTLQAALTALSGATPTEAQLDAANAALTALNGAIAGAADLTDDEKAPYTREATNAAAPISMAKAAKDKADDDADDAKNKAMAALAVKLYEGIGNYPFGYTSTNDVTVINQAGYDSDFDDVEVTLIQNGTARALSEDEKTMVAANHGWAGKRYTHTSLPTLGTYEAVVYSNVETPTPGRKFGNSDATKVQDNNNPSRPYEYRLTGGRLTLTSADATKVAFTNVTRTSGTETFDVPDNNLAVMIPGSYHGVSGTYSCTPAGEGATSCSATVATNGGFTLSNDTWNFAPGNPEAQVTDAKDDNFASYGWWIYKPANGSRFTISTFTDEVEKDSDAVSPATGLADLNGKATYEGGAAGHYALQSATGGTNDAGAFTARATLNATFGSTDKISGTIDNFVGPDGAARDWSVELKKGNIIDSTAAISGPSGNQTEWTIGEKAADASGTWSGTLLDTGKDGVPKVATGRFFSRYGQEGRMVGAFGVNKQ